MAKLTDFGHWVSAHEELSALPAFTPEWSATDVLEDHTIDFGGMKATDVDSFGLVILSILIGRAYWSKLEDFKKFKDEGTMLENAMEMIEQHDRKSNDSDLELDTILLLLRATLQQSAERRRYVRNSPSTNLNKY